VSIIRLKNVPKIAQQYDGTCWFASMRMLAEWRKKEKGGLGDMVDPATHKDCKDMAENNRGWPPSIAGVLAGWIKAKKRSDIKMEFDSLSKALTTDGPIWAAGLKRWGTAAHNHVVVIFGVADTGVLVNDPEPVGVGLESWKTWAQIRQYIDESESDVKFLVCP
jgi:hypothetical protein